MLSKKMSRYVVSVLGIVFAVSICIGLSVNMALAEISDPCGDNDEFTTYFRLANCKFINKGANPYFILKPGYQLVLESEDEKSVETVLCDTKVINLDGRRIKTRVVEERAYEGDLLVEISLNYFAICKKTNAVYYFGEWSRDCENGFDEEDECTGEESNDGSWEAGVNGAMPGLIMPGTPLQGAKYFQEIAFPDAVDRGEVVEVGFPVDLGGVGSWEGCIQISDTNPADDPPVCDSEEDEKIYCPVVGLVQDQELVLVEFGYVGCDDDDDDDDDKRGRSGKR